MCFLYFINSETDFNLSFKMVNYILLYSLWCIFSNFSSMMSQNGDYHEYVRQLFSTQFVEMSF